MNKSNQERRLAYKLIEYWEKLVQQSGTTPPFIDSLNPKVIWGLWQQCLHLQLLPASQSKFQVMHIGAKLLDIIPITHERLTVIPSDASLPYYKLLQLVEKNLSTTTPILFEGAENLIESNMGSADKKLAVKYRSCLLPFRSISGKVNNFVVGISYKEDNE